MADMALQVVVSPLLGVVFDKLSSPLLREFGLVWGVQEDLEKLSRTSSIIRLVLEDAELKQIHDAVTRDWLRKLKEVAYESDDVIDECITEALYSPNFEVNGGSCSTQVCDFFSTCFDFKRLKLRHKIAKQIKEVREKFDAIAEERKFHLNERAIVRGPIEDFNNYRESSSVILEECVYGRDLDKEKIIRVLLNSASNENSLLVYSVVGIGGLGKTTLAQCVYNDTSIQENFQSKIWVCVSEDFNATRLTKVIIESVSRAKCDLENLDALQNRLKELLSGKKFLLVLDDVWNEDQGNWDKLKFPLKCGAHGSSIIVTTRSFSVAQIMDALPPNQHRLAPLSEEECWSLFKGMAFGGEVIDNSELERIGKEIVRKCGGVPLAAKALGGSLQLVREVNEWKSVCNSAVWELREDGGILPSLRLSYNHLSPVMKQCFSYCSIFPKDHEIEVEELIQLWMANGLLQSVGTLDLEDVGRQTFNQLVWRSFFQDVENDVVGVLRCKMHDLMHDLACLVAENECLAFDCGREIAEIPKSIRHLSISSTFTSNPIPTNTLECLSNLHPFLRTFLLTDPYYKLSKDIVFESHRCLRVLDISNSITEFIPESIGRMKHLRYLNLSGLRYIVHLPSSLCYLKNLQTLKLKDCENLIELPEKMNNLVNLIYLDLSGCISLIRMPPRIGELCRLRSLRRFIVGSGNGRSIQELGKLDKLRGGLEIERLELVRDVMEARLANLAAKTNLIHIRFRWGDEEEEKQDTKSEEEVFEALKPHQDLSGKLQIIGYRGLKFPSWIHNMEKLREIDIYGCCKCEDLPPLGHLPLLKTLYIQGMDSLKRINKEFYGTSSSRSQNLFFPKLKYLRFGELPNLEECEALDDTHMLFPCLQNLWIIDCPKLASPLFWFQNLTSLRTLRIFGCDPDLKLKCEKETGEYWPYISHIPDITIF